MEKEWITTSELLGFLKSHPDDEFTCRLYLGYRLGSTHYWYWDSQERMFMHTRDWPFFACQRERDTKVVRQKSLED